MGRRKHLRLFHTQGGEFIDVEEPPIVDLFRRHPPVTETVDLRLQQGVEQIKTVWLFRYAVEQRHIVLKKLPHRRVGVGQRR